MYNIQICFKLIYKYLALELLPKTVIFFKFFTLLISTVLSESSCNNNHKYTNMPVYNSWNQEFMHCLSSITVIFLYILLCIFILI